MDLFDVERDKETITNWLYWMENQSAGILIDFLRNEMERYREQASQHTDNVLLDIRNTDRSLTSYRVLKSVLDKIAEEMQAAKVS